LLCGGGGGEVDLYGRKALEGSAGDARGPEGGLKAKLVEEKGRKMGRGLFRIDVVQISLVIGWKGETRAKSPPFGRVLSTKSYISCVKCRKKGRWRVVQCARIAAKTVGADVSQGGDQVVDFPGDVSGTRSVPSSTPPN